MSFQALQPRAFAVNATDDIGNVSPCEMESIINQLMNPSPEYQLHVSHLFNFIRLCFEGISCWGFKFKLQFTSSSIFFLSYLKASALRNQLKSLLRERQLAVGEEQPLGDYSDYVDEDKRSVAALAAQGLLNAPKRSLATLAKNGQLPQLSQAMNMPMLNPVSPVSRNGTLVL